MKLGVGGMRAIFVSRDQNLTLERVPRDAGEPDKGLRASVSVGTGAAAADCSNAALARSLLFQGPVGKIVGELGKWASPARSISDSS